MLQLLLCHCNNGCTKTALCYVLVESIWNVMAHGDAREGKWIGNWRMEWVASTLHTTSEHVVSSITTTDAHTLAASSRLNWRPCRFKLTRPFRRKTKSFLRVWHHISNAVYNVCLANENIYWGKGGFKMVDVKGHKEKATHLCLQQ
jgi:hypothetical protein